MTFHPDKGNDDASHSLAPAGAHSVPWRKALGITLIVGAVVIIVVDAVKDVGTLGTGAVETPLSWAAAARMFASGASMWRMATL